VGTTVIIERAQSAQVSHIVKLSGIVIGASQVRSKAVSLTIACTNCGHKQANIPLQAGFEGFAFPRQCANARYVRAHTNL
jgi:DNA replication licensing factor MCM5